MNWPGEALLIKLWETLAEKGIGGLLRPWQIRREGLAQIDVRHAEILALADAERVADDLRAGRREVPGSRLIVALPVTDGPHSRTASPAPLPALPAAVDGSASELPCAAPTVVDVAVNSVVADTLRREVNIAKAVLFAEDALRDDPQPAPNSSIQDDWLFRWREYAGATSADELRAIWGRLLAGELRSPGAYSLRTLDLLRSISASEAQRIKCVSQFVLDGAIVRSQASILEEAGLPFAALLELQEIGVLSGVESITMTKTYKSLLTDSFQTALRSYDRAIIVEHDDPSKSLSIPAYVITNVGEQVLTLGSFGPNEKYLEEVGKQIKQQGFRVSLARLRIEGTSMHAYDARAL